MLSWFQAIMPKEERFFELFSSHAAAVLAGAEALEGLFRGGDTIERYCRIIFERESEADEITRQSLTAVRRTFITPFDRNDIQDLVGSLDDSIDQMNKTAKLITLYEVKSFEPQMQQMAAMAPEAARLVRQAMPLLSSIGKNHADHRHRGKVGPSARCRPQGAVPRASQRQRDGFHHRRRNLRSPREGHGSI
jgi:uncharacterized protein